MLALHAVNAQVLFCLDDWENGSIIFVETNSSKQKQEMKAVNRTRIAQIRAWINPVGKIQEAGEKQAATRQTN